MAYLQLKYCLIWFYSLLFLSVFSLWGQTEGNRIFLNPIDEEEFVSPLSKVKEGEWPLINFTGEIVGAQKYEEKSWVCRFFSDGRTVKIEMDFWGPQLIVKPNNAGFLVKGDNTYIGTLLRLTFYDNNGKFLNEVLTDIYVTTGYLTFGKKGDLWVSGSNGKQLVLQHYDNLGNLLKQKVIYESRELDNPDDHIDPYAGYISLSPGEDKLILSYGIREFLTYGRYVGDDDGLRWEVSQNFDTKGYYQIFTSDLEYITELDNTTNIYFEMFGFYCSDYGKVLFLDNNNILAFSTDYWRQYEISENNKFLKIGEDSLKHFSKFWRWHLYVPAPDQSRYYLNFFNTETQKHEIYCYDNKTNLLGIEKINALEPEFQYRAIFFDKNNQAYFILKDKLVKLKY